MAPSKLKAFKTTCLNSAKESTVLPRPLRFSSQPFMRGGPITLQTAIGRRVLGYGAEPGHHQLESP